MDDGRICILPLDGSGGVEKTIKPHTGPVLALTTVGDQVGTKEPVSSEV